MQSAEYTLTHSVAVGCKYAHVVGSRSPLITGGSVTPTTTTTTGTPTTSTMTAISTTTSTTTTTALRPDLSKKDFKEMWTDNDAHLKGILTKELTAIYRGVSGLVPQTPRP